ncbi:MAG: phosphoribosylformylglycinamidine synthase subunit PurS [Calditrichaeota bacterium]|nr:phosphoribosylformylglycinamidine synthase subunit PurS [Calditrichota bacterium]MCB9366435.1 phosphoribosylformylglycinamidine synthase subunit PurS [Calditrichota bacterium]
MKAVVTVELKEGVLDPQGQAIQQLLAQRGYSGIDEVRVGKRIEFSLATLDGSRAETMLSEIADKLLANPVIERFHIDLK